MSGLFARVLFAGLALVAAQAASAPVASAADEIVVTGKRAGPRLWRVHDADSEVFVLATVEYLPEDLDWDDRTVAGVLEEADTALVAAKVAFGAGNRARLLGAMVRTMTVDRERIVMPKGTTLADRVGPDLAAEFDAARARAAVAKDAAKAARKARGKKPADDTNDDDDADADAEEKVDADSAAMARALDKIEPSRFHPVIQAGGLTSEAAGGAGLESFAPIEKKISRLARRAGAKVKPLAEFEFAFSDARLVLRSMKDFSETTNRACISEAVDFSNEGVVRARRLADAWARGDVEGLRANAVRRDGQACARAISDELGGLKTLGGASIVEFDGEAVYIDAIMEALATPGVRLALVPVDNWLAEGAALDRLRAAGVAVD